MLTFSLPFSACGGRASKDYRLDKYGIYNVTEATAGVSFTARFSPEQRELCFHTPTAISGMSAVSADGNAFDLTYEGVKVSVGGFAVKTASDFFCALELLEEAGTYSADTIEAVVDGISAKAQLKDGLVTEIDYYDGLNNRKYKITTEATGWTTVQKQG